MKDKEYCYYCADRSLILVRATVNCCHTNLNDRYISKNQAAEIIREKLKIRRACIREELRQLDDIHYKLISALID